MSQPGPGRIKSLIGFWNNKSVNENVSSSLPSPVPKRFNKPLSNVIVEKPRSDSIADKLARIEDEHRSQEKKWRERGGVQELASVSGGETELKEIISGERRPNMEEDEDAQSKGTSSEGGQQRDSIQDFSPSTQNMVQQHHGPSSKQSSTTNSSPAAPPTPSSHLLSTTYSSPTTPTLTPSIPIPTPTRTPTPARLSPFAMFQQLEKETSSSTTRSSGSVVVKPSTPPAHPGMFLAIPATPTTALSSPSSPTSPGQSRVPARSGSGAKELVMDWIQKTLKEYPIPVTNLSSCWSDGLAFCALVHCFYPEALDWFALSPENRRYNFTLAFEKAEEFGGLYPLLEVDDMVKMRVPDWKCVFTYVQSFYRRFRDVKPPTKLMMSSASISEAEEYLKIEPDAKQLEDSEEIEYLKRVIEDEKAIREAGQRTSDVKYMHYNTNKNDSKSSINEPHDDSDEEKPGMMPNVDIVTNSEDLTIDIMVSHDK